MTTLTILNDTHMGAIRSAGTTISSAAALTEWMHEQFAGLLYVIDTDLCILGDLFDKYDVPYRSSLEVYFQLSDWLGKGKQLYLVAGNHDLSKDSTKMGSFDFISTLLAANFPDQVSVFKGPGPIGNDVWVIPHLPNQDLFDLAMSEVPEGMKLLLLHCCYDNGFVAEMDHALGISREQAKKLTASGMKIIIAHEHQAQTDLGGKVIVPGNQITSSVSDCLGNETKKYLRVTLDG